MKETKMMKTVLITGCSSGFGRKMVGLFLERGWRVIATMREAEKRRGELGLASERLTVVELDIRSAEQRAAVVELCGGRLDCLVNNAGYALFGAFEDASEEQLRDQFEVNYFGLVLLTKALLPALRAARGKIINISSLFGRVPFQLTSAYAASKFALEGWAESLRHELAPHGVQVSLVEPGAFETDFSRNAAWARGESETYALQTRNWRRNRAARAGRGPGPAEVASRVRELADAARMPLRVPIGRERMFVRFAFLLPELLRTRFMGFVFRKIFLAAAVLAVCFAMTASAGERGALTIEVSGFEHDRGQVVCALFASADGFPDEPEKALRRELRKIRNDRTVLLELGELAAGNYAVGCIHDENMSGELDANFLGIPTEGLAFSRGAKGMMGPPEFADARFEVRGPTRIGLKMSY